MLFLLLAAVGAGFLAASDLTGGNKAGVSVAYDVRKKAEPIADSAFPWT